MRSGVQSSRSMVNSTTQHKLALYLSSVASVFVTHDQGEKLWTQRICYSCASREMHWCGMGLRIALCISMMGAAIQSLHASS